LPQLVEHGVAALQGPLRDAEHGGWFARPEGHGTGKAAYLHAFVALAASSAVVAGVPVPRHCWRRHRGHRNPLLVRRGGRPARTFSRDWQQAEAYRGANSNMHGVEAFLALADVTGDTLWLTAPCASSSG
jgi:mannose/cellobiose epimerase-like protein (N-acyl-D-glucosamine 2-epimerase family)